MSAPAVEASDEPATGRVADALGPALMAAGALALCVGPFVSIKPNRIAEGEPLMLWHAVQPGAAVLLVGATALAATGLALRPRGLVTWMAPAAGLACVLAGVAWAAGRLVPPAEKLPRVSPDWGFWLAVACMALAMTDAVARVRPKPAWRIVAVFAATAVVAMVLRSGVVDGLSVMREYAVRSDVFNRELIQHLQLALGSAVVAVGLGLPLGVLLHRVAGARGPVLALLTSIQAVPSIALFGLLMAPLAWLAHAVPLLGAAGLRGIGAAPAFVALTLYALLPIVAASVTGLAGVSPAAVEAARGAGMTPAQVLWQVELPLAWAAVLSGMRVVLVQTIGLTTVAALIGGGGLGTFVFQGLGQTAIDLVLLGTLPVVAMALAARIVLDAAAEALRWTP